MPSEGLDVLRSLGTLAASRALFHSEADFQHALAWQLHLDNPGLQVRLEYRPTGQPRRMYVDLWCTLDGERSAIELKYFTRRLETKFAGERFELREQSAQDLGRYDFWKDVRRLEELTDGGLVDQGLAIILTNDAGYQRAPTRPDVIDADFRLHEGHVVRGRLAWGPGASAGTKRSREEPIELSGAYQLEWHRYSSLGSGPRENFHYLLVPVPPQGGALSLASRGRS